MAKQYWVGDFFVDVSRNQISQNKQPLTMPPKALSVLTCLAQDQGKVVSQDKLLSEVWGDTIVSPNALQRSIAQLRKALGDDGKVQTYIKTHAKQGYSLECDVRWLQTVDSTYAAPATQSTVTETRPNMSKPSPVQQGGNSSVSPASQCTPSEKKTAAKPGLKPFLIMLVIVLMAISANQFFSKNNQPLLSVGQIRAVTASDDKEFASIYSPDGQYILFHRYSELECVNNIWAKNVTTQQEHKLTKDIDIYGRHSFSPDGKQLVFIRTLDCEQPTTQKKCYQLMSLDFYAALKSPQSMRLLLECKNSEISTPLWLNNNNIALLQKHTDQWQLISYSSETNSSQVLHQVQDGNIITYDYSVTEDLIAVTSIHADGQYYIEILKTDGELVSSYPIQYPAEIARHRFIFPNFSPIKHQLIFSTGRQLFTLSYDGQVTNVSLPLDEPMSTPTFHPQGNLALAIKGNYDSDIISIPLSMIDNKQTQNKQLKVLERSTVADGDAISQPNGELIAFESERSGEEQVWVTDGSSPKQISHFPMDSYISGMQWAMDGQSLLVNTNDTLVQVDLNSNQTPYPLSHPVLELLQWDSNNNKALLLTRIKGIIKLAELDLSNSTLDVLTDKRVNWAQKSARGELIYSDHMDRFWRRGPVEDQLITTLNHQGADKQRFLLQNNVIYGVNNALELWSYDLDEDKLTMLGNSPTNLDYLSDITASHLWMTVQISSQKQVAELILRQ